MEGGASRHFDGGGGGRSGFCSRGLFSVNRAGSGVNGETVNYEKTGLLLLEMAAGFILGAVIFSYLAPALSSTQTAAAA